MLRRRSEVGVQTCLESLESRTLLSVSQVFQQGVGGYAAAHDTHVRLDDPAASFGGEARLTVDLDDNKSSGNQSVQALLRFDDLFGSQAGRIPTGAHIVAATLTVRTGTNGGDNSKTATSLHRMLVNWSDDSTWDSLSGGVSANNIEAASTADATFTPSSRGAAVAIDVTATVQSWASNPAANFGWAFLPQGTDGWWWNASEASSASNRPSLSITYDADAEPPPPPTNQAPNVSAGPDRSIALSGSALLDGTVSDDGLPVGSVLTSTWSKAGGPGTVTFGNANSMDTTVTFSQTGTYTLRLTASDGSLSDSDEMVVTVTNTAPPPPPTTTQTLDSLKLSENTGEKPQSKIWKHDGKWWGVFPNSSGTWVWRLDGTSWTNVLKLSSSTSTHADVVTDGQRAHALLYTGSSSQLASIEYVSGQYELWSARPSPASVSLGSGVETAAVAIDGNGRMWVAYEAGNTVYVRYSDGPYNDWSSPISLGGGLTSDDIADIESFPDGSVGVLWSNQNTERFGFRKHSAGASPTSWSADEVPAGSSAQSVGNGMADDHINLAVASNGTLYAAIKTSYDSSGKVCIGLLVRRANGQWDGLHTVDTGGTRGVVAINEAANSLIVAYTSSNGGGNIYYKKSSMSNISFGSRSTLLSGSLNNVSTTRQNNDGDVVFVAANSSDSMSGIRLAWSAGASQTTTLASTATFSSTPLFSQGTADEDERASLFDELAAAA